MTKNKNINKFSSLINNEVEWLKKDLDNKIITKQDQLHSYSIIKNTIKNENVNKQNEKIQKYLKNSKQKIKNLNLSYTKSIKKLENINDIKGLSDFKMLLIILLGLFRRRFLLLLFRVLKDIFTENKLMLIIFGIAVIVGIINPVFFSSKNIYVNVLKNNSTIGIMAIGMTFVILSKGIDLSVGSLLGFAGIFSMGFMLQGMPTLIAFILGGTLTFLLGFMQGFLISYFKLPPFIVTLVGLLSIRGIVYIYAKGAPKTDIGNATFDFIQKAEFLGAPFLVWMLLILVLMGMFTLKYTKFGRNVYSVGGNEEAAKLAGINTKRVLIAVYSISALTAAIASLSFVSQISSAGPTSGNSYALDVIAAVVLGGTSLNGGKGGVGKTFLGWLVISTLTNALVLLGYDSNWQLVFKGLVILISVMLDKDLQIMKKLRKIIIKYVL